MPDTKTIPTIDLKPLWDGSTTGIENIATQLKLSFASIGFAYLINHAVSDDLVESTFREAKRFHNLSLDEKLKIKHNDCFRGYMPLASSQIKVSSQGSAAKPNLVDSFVIMFEVDESHPDYKEGLYFAGPNQWPENLPGFKEIICQYRDAMLKLSFQLLKAFALALNVKFEELSKLFVDPTYFFRLQHYPEQKGVSDDNQFGIAPHTDAGFFTILAQDTVGGLEVKLESEDWISVPYIPNTLVMNAGSMLQRLSNDTFRAVPHRVLNRANRDRYSLPFFFDTNMHATIKVLDSCTTPSHPAKYPPIIYGEYLLNRLKGNYGLGKGTVSPAAKEHP